jgi:hypothetical protein
MNNERQYITPVIGLIDVSSALIILAASDHHTDFNLSKDNNLFMEGTEADDGNSFSNESGK